MQIQNITAGFLRRCHLKLQKNPEAHDATIVKGQFSEAVLPTFHQLFWTQPDRIQMERYRIAVVPLHARRFAVNFLGAAPGP